MCSNFLFNSDPLPHSATQSKSRHADVEGDYAELSRNAPKRNELRENDKSISIAKLEDLAKRFLKCVQHDAHVACMRNTRILDTYVYSFVRVYIYIYIFFLMLYFSYVSMYVYVCMCTCMYYGSAEVFARDFRTIKTQTYAGKRDVHIGLAWKRFNSLLFYIVSIFVNLPGDYFSIGSITRRAQVNKDNTSRYVRCC